MEQGGGAPVGATSTEPEDPMSPISPGANPYIKSSAEAMASVVEADLLYYENGKKLDRSVGWLLRREAMQGKRVAEKNMNHVRDYHSGQLIDLGAEVNVVWCFVFQMPQSDSAETFEPDVDSARATSADTFDLANAKDTSDTFESDSDNSAKIPAGTFESGGDNSGSPADSSTGSVRMNAKTKVAKTVEKEAAQADLAMKPWERPEQVIPFQVWQFCHRYVAAHCGR